MSKRLLQRDEKLALTNLADRFLAFRDGLAPNAIDFATKFLDDYAFIKRAEFSGLATNSKSRTDILESMTAASAKFRVNKIAALHPDLAPPQKDGKGGTSDDTKTKKAFEAAIDSRRILAEQAEALLLLLARLPGELPQEQPRAKRQPPTRAAQDAGTDFQEAKPAVAPSAIGENTADQLQHFNASELGDFQVAGFPGHNHGDEGVAPLLVHFGFYRLTIPLDDFDENYELMINSANLRLEMTEPPREVETDREVYDENNAKLRIKREWNDLDGKKFRFLVENPEKSRQLEGVFREIELCHVADASTVGVKASLTVAAGQIAVWHQGRIIGSGAQNKSMAAKVVSQWAVWAGLGKPPGENPAYHLGTKSIEGMADD